MCTPNPRCCLGAHGLSNVWVLLCCSIELGGIALVVLVVVEVNLLR